MRTNLTPSLSVIEAGLFAPSDVLLERWLANELDPATQQALAADTLARERRETLETGPAASERPAATAEAPSPPAWLTELVTQQREATAHPFAAMPKPGQILRIDAPIGPAGPLDVDQPRPLAVLYDQATEHARIGYGWLVGAETDYAGEADVLLEAGDGPHDPLAGMIQTWNPVYVYLPSAQAVLAELSPERRQAVRTLALDYLLEAPPEIAPEPGVRVARRTSQGQPVLTGPPLGDAHDPRHRYRTLYRAAAELLREPVRLAQLQPPILERLWAALTEATRGQFGLQPAPAPVMGDTEVVPQRLGDWLELQPNLAEDEHTLDLQVKNLQPTPCRLEVMRGDRVLREYPLAGNDRIELPALPITADSALVLADTQGQRCIHWPLSPVLT